MKSVFLDCAIVNPGDISWERLQELSDFTWYERTAREQVTGRIRGAEAVFIDAVAMDRKTMEDCPELKFIGIAATGFNHVDLDAARELGIAVANVPSYAGDAVAQHAIALLLAVTNKVQVYNDAIIDGQWAGKSGLYFREGASDFVGGKIHWHHGIWRYWQTSGRNSGSAGNDGQRLQP